MFTETKLIIAKYLLVTQVMKKTFINKSLFRSILEKEGKREGGIQLEILIDHQL